MKEQYLRSLLSDLFEFFQAVRTSKKFPLISNFVALVTKIIIISLVQQQTLSFSNNKKNV